MEQSTHATTVAATGAAGQESDPVLHLPHTNIKMGMRCPNPRIKTLSNKMIRNQGYLHALTSEKTGAPTLIAFATNSVE